MISAGEADAQLILLLGKFMASCGFRKKGTTFTRSVNDVIQLVNYQRSVNGTSCSVLATLNVGAYSSKLAAALGDPTTTSDIWLSPWMVRLGNLLPHCEDKWWSLSSSANLPEPAQEIISKISDYALPALAAIDSTAKLALMWQSGRSPGQTAQGAKYYLKVLPDEARPG